MSAPHTEGMLPPDIEIAAGGLVWALEGSSRHLAVVHRPKHGDWTLPKGRLQSGETTEAAASREAAEETRFDVIPDTFAGSYCYRKEDRIKVVLMWHMNHVASPYEHPAPKDEIDEVLWLPPDQALSRLSHPTEREFLQRHSLDAPDFSFGAVTTSPKRFRLLPRWMTDHIDPQLSRLKARLQSAREQFEGCVRRWDEEAIKRPTEPPDRWWIPAVHHSLCKTAEALERRDLDGGWGALHDAEKFLIFGMTDVEVVVRAISLKTEAEEKLHTRWRAKNVDTLLGSLNLRDCLKVGGTMNPKERMLLNHSLVESLTVLNEGSDNIYHRMHLVGKQLKFLVLICACILAFVLWGSYLLVDAGSPYDWGHLVTIALAGTLGGVVSAMFQLSRAGDSKIPDALLYGLITSGRPLLGAASALFIYFVMQANLLSFLSTSTSNLETGVVVGFVAGFGERLVLKAVDKIAGPEKADSPAGNKSGASAGDALSEAGTPAKPK